MIGLMRVNYQNRYLGDVELCYQEGRVHYDIDKT